MNPEEYSRMDAEETTGWWFVGKRLFIHATLQEFAILGPKAMILDAGCGTGAVLRSFSEGLPSQLAKYPSGSNELYGLDPARLAIRFARKKCPAKLVCGTAEQLPYRDETFDLVLLLDVLEHLDDDAGALQEVYRVLKIGGHVVLTVPAFPCLWSDHDVALHHRRRYRRRQVAQLLERVPFEHRYLGCIYASVFPAAVVYRLWRRGHPARQPRADLGTAPPTLNYFLCRLMEMEARLATRVEQPFGTSILALAKKIE